MRLFTRTLLLPVILSFFSQAAFAQLSAGFTADATAGCAPLVVHFTNTTTPSSGTTYDWNFGNGDPIAHSVNTSTSFTSPGTYTVTLTAHNGGATSIHTITITVYPSPTVSFTASDTSVCPGTPVSFTSTSTGGVPGPVTSAWNFGDGTSGSGTVASHTYLSPGWYNVTLSCTNADGCVSSLTKPVYMHIFTPASVNFSAATYYCKAPGHAVFTNLTSGTGPFSYTWRFGDGSAPSTAANPTHDYTAPGTYAVTLVVTDGNGCTDSLVIPAYITVANLHADFTAPATACVSSTVTFTDISSAHIGATWYYGDGGSSTGDPGLHSYSTPGTYPVKLVVYDGHCYDTMTHNITITPGPVASFTTSPLQPCPPFAITFTSSVPPGTMVTWLYGDGGSGTGTTSTHTYGTAGGETVKMIAVDPATGCRDTVTQSLTFYDLQLVTTATPDHGCKPLTVSFSTTAITHIPGGVMHPYPWPIATYSWNFGDGSPVTGSASPTHTYTAVGSYMAHITATTTNGCVVQDSVLILVGTPPVVTFTATPTHECYHNNLVTFTVTVLSGPVDTFVWIFNDGGDITTSTTETHHYTLPGIFGATVIPMYHGCPGPPFGLANIITIDSPKAIISDQVLCSPPKRVNFGDSSLGDDTHLWMFGDGSTSTLKNPVHDYASLTIYTVTLTTYNIHSGCRDTATRAIDLRRPMPNFSAPDTAFCRDSLAVLTASVTGGSASGYFWHSAGRSADSFLVTYVDTFHTTGIYPIELVIVDQNGCYDTLVKPNYIHVAKPVALFTVSPSSGCWPLTTTFTDASNDIPGTFFTQFAWDFGDLTTATVATPYVTHTYYNAGAFTTTEIVTDNIGCKDTVTLPLVTVYRPHAVFSATNLHPCTTDSTNFINASTGIVGSFWIFGDGGTSSLNSPWHRYTAPGSYTVKLVVTDSHGCTDTANYVAYINVTKPAASFHMDDSVSICPPLTVHFINTSTGGIFYNWNLGDGSSSTMFGPSDLYITTGYDTVRLIVSNAYGCRDTAYGHVNIFGYAGAFSYAPLRGCSPLRVNFYATTLNVPNIIWDFADGSTSLVAYTDTISHVYTQPGAFVPKLILSDNTGCQNSSVGIDTIKIDAVEASFRTLPNPVCLGDTFMLADSAQSYWSAITGVSWNVNGITTTVDSPSFFINSVGAFPATLVVTDGWGCTATVNNDVNIYAPPVIRVSPDTTVCAGDPATLTGYGGVSYTWAPAVNLSCTACNPTNASPSVVTSYTVTGKDAHGCMNTDTTTVFLRTKTIAKAWGDTAICFGAVVPLFDTGGTKYTWIPGSGLNDPHLADPLAHPGSTTRYMAIAQLAGCIPDTNYVTVIVHQLPTVDAGPDQTLIAGSTAQLNATGSLISHYLWDNSQTLSCDTCAGPVASMSVTTTYVINVASDFGCRNSDSVTIHIYCDNSQIFIPNSFTPNHDGENDVFYPRGTGVSLIKSFRIYNRWGELLFERTNISMNDQSNGWDGSFKGGSPRPDVYVWVLDTECETGQSLNLKGDVTIIR